MKKQLISTLLVVSALSFASAQTATSTASTTPPVLPAPAVTGDVKIDAQIRALNKEMEAKIRAIREEYQIKLKALIGARKAVIASSTKQMREEQKERREDLREELKDKRDAIRASSSIRVKINQGATSTSANPQGNAWGFFTRFFGQVRVNQ